jgi:hypothetical protein
MAITAITIENFKGIREPVRVELKPITLLFGPNSAGKSTIVQALHYAREIFERHNLNPDRTLLGGSSIDLGGFESLVHQHDKSLPIRLAFELDLTNEDLPDYMSNLPDFARKTLAEYDYSYQTVTANILTARVEIEVRWDSSLEKPYLAYYSVVANGHDLLEIRGSGDGLQINVSKINPVNPIFWGKDAPLEAAKTIRKYVAAAEEKRVTDDTYSDLSMEETGHLFPWLFFYFDHSQGVPGISTPMYLLGQKSALPVWEKLLQIDGLLWDDGFEESETLNLIRSLSSLAVGPGELVRDGLRKLCYIGPLREVPARNHLPATSPEEARWANGLAAYDILATSDETFIRRVNEWLNGEDYLACGYSVEVKKYRELETDNPLMLAMLQGHILDDEKDLRDTLLSLPIKRRLLIRDEARDIELAPQDIGVGISQVLPVVVAALRKQSGIVAIEQPELHIHPAFQVALGDLFIEQIRQRDDLIFILETHSEHLMLRFLRRIRETSENEAPSNRSLTPAELSIYFIEQGDAGISCQSIRVDKDGDFIDRWPHGFFAERAGELF